MSVLDRVRPELLALRGYSSARMEASGGRVLLNANESPWPDPRGLNRYPEPQPAALLARLAALYGVPVANVLAGRGSDEAIDLLTRAYCRAGVDAVAIAAPTFGMYAVCAAIQGARVLRVPLRRGTYEFPFAEVIAAVRGDDGAKLVYVCAPNNPTGSLPPRDDVLALARELAGRALVVVDEAYVEFAGRASLAPEAVKPGANLVVLRTLSKAYGLAGARVGALIGDAALVALLRRLMAPYPLPAPSVAHALAALAPAAIDDVAARVAAAIGERQRLADALRASASVREVLPSAANFVTARFDDAAAVHRDCLARGIVLRDVSADPLLAGCLRISIGLPAENDALLALLATREPARGSA